MARSQHRYSNLPDHYVHQTYRQVQVQIDSYLVPFSDSALRMRFKILFRLQMSGLATAASFRNPAS